MTAAIRMSAVKPYKRIRDEGEILFENIKAITLWFHSYFLPRPFLIYHICYFQKCKKV